MDEYHNIITTAAEKIIKDMKSHTFAAKSLDSLLEMWYPADVAGCVYTHRRKRQACRSHRCILEGGCPLQRDRI